MKNKRDFGVFIMLATHDGNDGYLLSWKGFTEEEADQMCRFLAHPDNDDSDIVIIEISKQRFMRGER